MRPICHLSLRCTGKVFSYYKLDAFSPVSTCAAAASGAVSWRAVGEGDLRSLAASPAVCCSHRREGYYVVHFVGYNCTAVCTRRSSFPHGDYSLSFFIFASECTVPPPPSTSTPPPHTEVVALLSAETPTGDRHSFGSRIELDVCRIEMLSLA